MRKFIFLAGTALGFVAGPAAACDLDGMFGPHRFNAFANLSGQSMFDPDPQSGAQPEAPQSPRAEVDESAEGDAESTSVATLTVQMDREPTDPPASEKSAWSDEQTPRGSRDDDAGPAPSAMFR